MTVDELVDRLQNFADGLKPGDENELANSKIICEIDGHQYAMNFVEFVLPVSIDYPPKIILRVNEKPRMRD